MKARVRANGVLVRQSNSNMSPVIGSVAPGTVLDIEAEYGEWVKLTSGGWVKTCYTEAMEVSGGGASSWNDLEDKPFYADTTVIEWDGNTEGLTSVADAFFKVSDLTPVAEEIGAGSFALVYDGSENVLDPLWGFMFNRGNGNFCIGEGFAVCVHTVPFDFGYGAVFNETGLYFANYNGSLYGSRLEWSEVKTIDPKCLPFDTETVDKYDEVVLVDGAIKPYIGFRDLISPNSANLQEGDTVRVVIQHDGSKLDTTGTLGKMQNMTAGYGCNIELENYELSDTLSVSYIQYYPISNGDAFYFLFTASSEVEAAVTVTHKKLVDSYPVINAKNLPFLKITYDGTSYAANMTYEEAVALIESKSLLGGCYIGEDNAVHHVEDIAHNEAGWITVNGGGYGSFILYADGTVSTPQPE